MLSVSGLTFGYASTPLFKDLSFRLDRGELLHIKGANGAGKSTLMSILAGLMQPDHGQIEFESLVTKEYLPAEGCGHYLKLDAQENLRFWLALHGRSVNAAELRSEIDFWHLSPVILTNQIPVELYSTGMKRKLALARVKLSGAQLWLLDEPVSGLDDFALHQFSAMVRRHLDEGGCVAVISHDTTPLAGLVGKNLTIGAT